MLLPFQYSYSFFQLLNLFNDVERFIDGDEENFNIRGMHYRAINLYDSIKNNDASDILWTTNRYIEQLSELATKNPHNNYEHLAYINSLNEVNQRLSWRLTTDLKEAFYDFGFIAIAKYENDMYSDESTTPDYTFTVPNNRTVKVHLNETDHQPNQDNIDDFDFDDDSSSNKTDNDDDDFEFEEIPEPNENEDVNNGGKNERTIAENYEYTIISTTNKAGENVLKKVRK